MTVIVSGAVGGCQRGTLRKWARRQKLPGPEAGTRTASPAVAELPGLENGVERLAHGRGHARAGASPEHLSQQRLQLHGVPVGHVVMERGVAARFKSVGEGQVPVWEVGGKADPFGSGHLAHLCRHAAEELAGGGDGSDLPDRKTDGGGGPRLGADESELVPQRGTDVTSLLGAEAGRPASLNQPG